MRTHYCGELNQQDIGQVVSVCGWVNRRRDHGGVIFVDLRDKKGMLQVVFDPDDAAMFSLAESLRNEFCVKSRRNRENSTRGYSQQRHADR